MKVAVAKYSVGQPAGFEAFAARQRLVLEETRRGGAELAVLPEYLSLELAATFEPGIRHDFNASLAALQALQPAWLALYADLSRELCMTIQRSEERGVGKECVRTCRFRWSPDR